MFFTKRLPQIVKTISDDTKITVWIFRPFKKKLISLHYPFKAVQCPVFRLQEHLHKERFRDESQDPALPPRVFPLLSLH
jgi:hypothetical protein